MRKIISLMTLVTTVNAFGSITLPLNYNVHGTFTELNGDDAKVLHSIFGTTKFRDNIRGIREVKCDSEEACTILAETSGIYRSNRSEYDGSLASGAGRAFTNESDRVETEFLLINFFKTLPEKEGEKYFVTPSASMYYHDRDSVLENDKKIFKKMEKSKSPFIKRTVQQEKIILEAETSNLKMTCVKSSKPQKYTVSAGHPHAPIDLSIFDKTIKLTHSCRTYFRAQAAKLPQPIIVNTRDNRIEVYKLNSLQEVVPVAGVEVTQILDPNPSYVTGGTKKFTTATNDQGVAQVERELVLNYSDFDAKDAALVTKVDVVGYLEKIANGKGGCANKSISIRKFVKAVAVDINSGKVMSVSGDVMCGTEYSGVKGLHAGTNYPTQNKTRRVYAENGNDYIYLESKCVLVGTAVPTTSYEASETFGYNSNEHKNFQSPDITELESLHSGIARFEEACSGKD